MSERRDGAIAGGVLPKRAKRLALSLLSVTLGVFAFAAVASASVTFERTWGWGVSDGSNAFQICTSSCQAGSTGIGDGQLNTPTGIATDSVGDVYVTDSDKNRVERFDSSGNFITKWGSPGTGDGQFGVVSPFGIATGASGNVYAADRNNHRVDEFSSSGSFLRTWGWGVSDGSSAFQICTSSCHAGSHGTGDGQFYAPTGIATDSVGDVYVTDQLNSRIEKFDSSGNFISKWGGTGSGDGQFELPIGVATDSSGNVYVADVNNNRIEKFDSSGNFLRTWGWGVSDGSSAFQICTSSCQAGSSGSGDGQFSVPYSVATDSIGDVYVAELNNRIQKFDSSGNFITKWGSEGSGDGQFELPIGVATDSAGDVYVTDADNNRVQEFAVAPDAPTLSSSPASPANDNTPKITGTAQPGSTVKLYASTDCSGSPLAIGSAADFASPGFPISVADDSSTTFYATATDVTTSPCSSGLTYVEDSTPPGAPTISGSSPASPANNNSPKLSGSAEAGSTIKLYTTSDCSGTPAAAGGASSFSSPGITVSVTDNSTTTFKATATDSAGNTSACSSGLTYTEDSIPPSVSIDSGPSGLTNNARPTFGFSSTDPSATFRCSIDHGTPSFGACSGAASDRPASNLADGSWTFRVKASDQAANSTTAIRHFTVDATPPQTTIAFGPISGQTKDRTPTFAFKSSEHGSTFACSLDHAAYRPCTSPHTTAQLAFGGHTFDVRATDSAHNTDPTPAHAAFKVVH